MTLGLQIGLSSAAMQESWQTAVDSVSELTGLRPIQFGRACGSAAGLFQQQIAVRFRYQIFSPQREFGRQSPHLLVATIGVSG